MTDERRVGAAFDYAGLCAGLAVAALAACSSGGSSGGAAGGAAGTASDSGPGGTTGVGGSGGGGGSSNGGGSALCDGKPLPSGMRCIEGGTFTDAASGPHESHVIATFALDTTEVTVAKYAACVATQKCTPPATLIGCNSGVSAQGSHPVNCVDFDQANAYCSSIGARLPSEWEWEWAARGRDEARVFPWGSAAPGDFVCWFGTAKGTGTCEAGGYSPKGDSRDGVQDLAGNVWEWTDSTYELGKDYRIIRGGSWNTGNGSSIDELRADFRGPTLPGTERDIIGFRCALTL